MDKEVNGLMKQRRIAREKCKEKDKEIEELNNIIDKQDRDITTLTKDKIKLKNIINELEQELEQEIAIVGANRTVDNNNPEWWYKLNCYLNILNKLKELKEGKDNEK